MNVRRIVTAALLAFVAASLVFMVTRSVNRNEGTPAAAENVVTGAENAVADAENLPADPYYAVYYFHGEKRCATCLTIEKYSQNTVEEAFAEQLASGELQWRVLDYDQPENRHYAKDYDISFQTLMVFEMDGEKPVRWKKLERIWDEVGSEFSFHEYVQSEVTAFMNEG